MATYGLRIRRHGLLVEDANTAQSVVINVYGGGNVEKFFAETGRWNVSVPRRIEDRIDRVGYQKALTVQVGTDAIEWR